MTFSDTKMNSRAWPAVGLIILVCAVIVILFSGASAITQGNVEARLKQFGDHVASEATRMGREAKFNYGTVEIEGWGYNKHATVEDVTLESTRKSLLDNSKWSLSTARMVIAPEPTSPKALAFIVPGPVNVIENSQLKTVVTFPAPLKYVYFDGLVKKAHTVEHTLHLPREIVLTPAKAADEPVDGKTAGRTIITYDANPSVRVSIQPENNERQTDYHFSNLKIAGDDGVQLTAGSVVSRLSEKPGEGGRAQGKYTLEAKDVALYENTAKTPKQYTLVSDLDYVGGLPVHVGAPVPQEPNTDVKVNQILLLSDDFKVKGEGNFSVASDDPLPFGNVRVTIENVQQFLASDLIPAQVRPLVTAAVLKVTAGQPDANRAEIPLKREKNGVLYVGDVTFEQLAASMLSDMLKQQSPGPASTALPPSATGESPQPPLPTSNTPAPVAPAPETAAPAQPSAPDAQPAAPAAQDMPPEAQQQQPAAPVAEPAAPKP